MLFLFCGLVFVSCDGSSPIVPENGENQPLTQQSATIRGTLDIPAVAGVSGSDFFVVIYEGDSLVKLDRGNDDGTFSVSGLKTSGSYNVLLTTVNPIGSKDIARGLATGYGGWLSNVTASVNEQSGVGTVKVKPLGTIKGVVTKEEASDNYDITVYIPGTSFSAITDRDGNYTISNVPQGDFRLRFIANGYDASMLEGINLSSDSDTESPTFEVPDVRLHVNVGILSGTVRLEGKDDHTGILIKIQNVANEKGKTDTTASSGKFTVSDIVPGTYDVYISYPGYTNETIRNVKIEASKITSLPEVVTLKPAVGNGTITGKVSIAGKTDLSGIKVNAVSPGEDLFTLTDSSGSFSLSLPEGSYSRIEISDPCYTGSYSHVISIFSNQTVDVGTITLDPKHNWITDTRAATCTDTGLTVRVCSVCGITEQEIIPATGHSYAVTWSKDNDFHWHAATCEHTDLVKDKAEHIWEDGLVIIEPTHLKEGTILQTCSVCGAQKAVSVQAIGEHAYSESWTSDEENHWHAATCGHDLVSDEGKHSWDSGTITTEPTHLTTGVRTFTCTVCGAKRTEAVPVLDTAHTFDEAHWTSDENYHWHAATCGHDVVKDKTAHSWSETARKAATTCTAEGSITYKCTICNASKVEVIPATGHTFSNSWTNDSTYHWHSTTCGHYAEKDKEEHTWVQSSVKAATCTASGTIYYKCSVCNATKTESIPALGHASDSGVTTKEATCAETGVKTYSCTTCGVAIRTESIPATAHEWNNGVITVQPTSSNVGVMTYTCAVCGTTRTESVYAVGSPGPAGGYVFYDKGYYSDGWRYLEAAPADLRVVDGVPTVDSNASGYSNAFPEIRYGLYRVADNGSNLYINGTTTYNAEDCTGTAIGTGSANTQLLVNAMGAETYYSDNNSDSGKTANYAARLCDILTYTVNGVTYDDWFLPSKDELNLMYINLKQKKLGGFADVYPYYYWSSSEYITNSIFAFRQNFNNGDKDSGAARAVSLRVRPVRAF